MFLTKRPIYWVAALAVLVAFNHAFGQSSGNRVLGLDVSTWQGNISQTTWNNLHNTENLQFVFIRSSRGGTTGVDQRSGGYPGGSGTTYNLSQRYDDPYFFQNITRATAAGMYAGAYHFARPDIIVGTTNSNGTTVTIPNSGADEADHFIQAAGAFMRPGYLPPVHDFEAGDNIRSDTQLAQFAIDFSNRIYERMGIRPAIYFNGNYANILTNATAAQRNLLALPSSLSPNPAGPAYTQIWNARWPTTPTTAIIQNGNPGDTVSTIYGPFDDHGTSDPWTFWQYTSTGRLQSYNNGTSDLDLNVLHGGMEYLKDQLVPAVWMTNTSGSWGTLANWNSGQTPVAPVVGVDQLATIGTGTLPTARLPGAAGTGPTAGSNDTVILDRPSANITITLSTGSFNIRKLYVRETLNITGGSLTINYVPVAESTAMSAQFSSGVSISGTAALSVHTLYVDPAITFTAGNATLTFNTLRLDRGTTPAKLALNGNITINASAAAMPSVETNTGTAATGSVDLSGGTRTITVPATGLRIAVPIVNGGLAKSGAGTMILSGASTYTGVTTVSQGKLLINGSVGATAVTLSGGTFLGGTGTIGGNAVLAAGTTVAQRATFDLTDGAIGTLTFSNTNAANTVLTLGGNTGDSSQLTFEVGAAGADRVRLTTGKLLVNPGGATININALTGFGRGTYDLLTFNSGQVTGLDRLSLSTVSLNGYSLSLQPTSTALQLVVVPEPAGMLLIALAVICLWKLRP